MSAFNNYMEQLLRDLFKNGAQIPTQDTYLGIATQDPTDTGTTAGEPTGAWYSRQLIETTGAATTPAWTSATTGTGIENAQSVSFPSATTTPGTITHFFLIDSTTGGANNMLMHTSVTNARSIASGDTPQFGAGDVQFTFD